MISNLDLDTIYEYLYLKQQNVYDNTPYNSSLFYDYHSKEFKWYRFSLTPHCSKIGICVRDEQYAVIGSRV